MRTRGPKCLNNANDILRSMIGNAKWCGNAGLILHDAIARNEKPLSWTAWIRVVQHQYLAGENGN
jgi:hypothetical protein